MQVGSDFSAQLDWRFACYGAMPYLLFALPHACLPDESKKVIATEVFGPKCCSPQHSCQKVAKLFESPAEMLADKEFLASLRMCASKFRVTNMRSERLLAACTTSVDGKAVEVEKVVAASFLTQMLTEHLALGRPDPRIVTRKQLVDSGLQTRVAQKHDKVARSWAGTFVEYKSLAESKRRAAGVSLSQEDYRLWLRKLAADFANVVSDEDKKEFASAKRTRELAADEPPPPVSTPSSRAKTFVGELGTAEGGPFPEAVLKTHMRNLLGLSSTDKTPSLTQCSHSIRKNAREGMYVENGGDVGEDSVTRTLICQLAHPGICATRHASHMCAITECTKGLQRHLQHEDSGAVFVVESSYENGDVSCDFFMLAHFRLSGPKVALLVVLSRSEDGLSFSCSDLCPGKQLIDHRSDKCAIGRLIVYGPAKCTGVRIASVTVSRYKAGHICFCDTQDLTFYTIHPFCAVPRLRGSSKPESVKYLLQGLASCAGRKRTAARRRSTVRIKMPGAGDQSDSDDYAESLVDAASDADSDGQVEDEVDDDPSVQQHQSRKMSWGPFLIAQVYGRNSRNEKVHCGWGATCARHRNRTDGPKTTACKTNLRGTDDETRRRVCWWIILGCSCRGDRARGDHVALDVLLGKKNIYACMQYVRVRVCVCACSCSAG